MKFVYGLVLFLVFSLPAKASHNRILPQFGSCTTAVVHAHISGPVHLPPASTQKTIYVSVPGPLRMIPVYVEEGVFNPTNPAAGGGRMTYDYRLLESVDRAMSAESGRKVSRVLVLGTGLGADTVWARNRFPDAEIVATEIDDKALAVAKLSVEMNTAARDVRFVKSDVFDALADEKFDLIIFNPPRVFIPYSIAKDLFEDAWAAQYNDAYFKKTAAERQVSVEQLRRENEALKERVRYMRINGIQSGIEEQVSENRKHPGSFDMFGHVMNKLLSGASRMLTHGGNLFFMSAKNIPITLPTDLEHSLASRLYDWGTLVELPPHINEAFTIHRLQKP